MHSFFKFAKTFNPYKFATASLFGSYLGFTGYRKAFMKHEPPKEDYSKQMHDALHAKDTSPDFFANVSLFSGNANKPLAEEIAGQLGTKLGGITVSRFADGECNIQVKENIRGKDVYIIQPTCPPVNDNLMELLLMVSTMRRASARKINVVIPYYGYCRQDRKTVPRVPISAADVARLLETMGVDRVIAIDLHCGQIQGFFGPRVPVDNLEANVAAVTYFKNYAKVGDRVVVVSPDAGGVSRAKKFQDMLKTEMPSKDIGLAMIIKHRDGPGKIAEMHLVGSVQNSDVIIVDDMIDTAGTLTEASKVLRDKGGAQKVYAFATHGKHKRDFVDKLGLFSGSAFENIKKSVLEEIVITNTIPAKPEESGMDKIIRLSVAPLLAEAIRRVQAKESVSNLFATTPK